MSKDGASERRDPTGVLNRGTNAPREGEARPRLRLPNFAALARPDLAPLTPATLAPGWTELRAEELLPLAEAARWDRFAEGFLARTSSRARRLRAAAEALDELVPPLSDAAIRTQFRRIGVPPATASILLGGQDALREARRIQLALGPLDADGEAAALDATEAAFGFATAQLVLLMATLERRPLAAGVEGGLHRVAADAARAALRAMERARDAELADNAPLHDRLPTAEPRRASAAPGARNAEAVTASDA